MDSANNFRQNLSEGLVIPLLSWYNDNQRDLPWRRDPTAYHVWLSEIMLQQTRVAAVLDYYRRFLTVLPCVADLAGCAEETLMKLWQGLGYYSRARNLQKAARVIMEVHGGEFPSDYAAIRALPGVGDYTAGASASIAFGQPRAAVDGNVLRVLSRVTANPQDITAQATKRACAAAVEEILPVRTPGAFNQALMELGATVCLPNGAPLCDRCPLRQFCLAYERDLTAALPRKAPKKARRVEERRVYLIFSGNRVALRRRAETGLLAGLWEYPNEVSPAAPPVAGRVDFARTAKHIFTHIEWHMTAYTVQAESDALPDGWVWADRAELAEKYSVPNAFQAFEQIVEEHL